MASASAKLGILSLIIALSHAEVAAAEVVVRREIFGNKGAADMVMKARSFDPRFVGSAKADRDRAVAMYEKAMTLQPGAKINAVLTNRIGELYGYYGDRRRGIRPDYAKALQWWTRCIDETNSKQILWAEAHMGLGCMRVLVGQPRESAADFKAILNLDVIGVEWPPWKVKPDTAMEHGKRRYEREMIRLRDRAEELHIKAVDKIHYVLLRVDGAAAVSTLLEIARTYEGLPVGDHAAKLAQRVLRDSRASVYRYKGLQRGAEKDLPGSAKRSPGTEAAGYTAAKAPSPAAPRPPAAASAPGELEPAPAPSARADPIPGEPPDANSTFRAVLLLLAAGAMAVVAAFMVRRARARRLRT